MIIILLYNGDRKWCRPADSLTFVYSSPTLAVRDW